MTDFEPVAVSTKIKEGFVDYITTSFDLADLTYRNNLREQLLQPGYISKGPYLELSGSYKTGRSISDLIEAGIASPWFKKLEPIAEKERELKLERPLYLHQERALRLANEGHNLVVTTGTGSGKTECFLIPIINHLLCEQEQRGSLEAAVRAIIIYPMNALANDQMKRMRALLKGYPEITFGLYNGNTKHEESDARKAYSAAHDGAEPLSNELISRETMQKTPPHILITNYSMLEYMMLRPRDDKVISGAKLRFIVLDEAHVYRGTTGMETAMLMRRLRARLDQPELARYILTSATLGGKDADQDIVTFAENLCGVSFQTSHIIRSQEALPAMLGEQDYPKELFTALAKRTEPVAQILARFQVADPCPEGDEGEKLFSLMLGSRIFAKLIEHTRQPKSLFDLCQELSVYLPLSEDDLTDLIAVCVQAEQGKSSLIRARYHYFVRTLEGAYITLGKNAEDKRLFLDRKESFLEDGQRWEVFEAAVCSDCGRLAVTGKESPEGYLKQVARKTAADPKECDYYLLKNDIDEVLEADDGEEEEETGEGNFVLCSRCGKIGTQVDIQFGPICDCEAPYYVPVVQTLRTKSGRTKCPACGFGHFRSFYLGNEAATAVLGTELFDQLPDQKMDIQATIKAREEMRTIQEDASNPFRRLNRTKAAPTITEDSARQFLCFSDSRSEAAFFASYMERSYEEFLRRRGMWKIVEEMRANGETSLSVSAFVERLIRLFDQNKTFQQWNPDKKTNPDNLHEESKRNAWIAVLNEMYNARRGTSLPSLGVLSFSYPHNEDLADALAENYDLPSADLRALLDLLVMDGVYSGALRPGHEYSLTDSEREYIFFTPSEQALTLVKTDGQQKNVTGWAARKRENGNYYPNTRLQRLIRSLDLESDAANKLLRQYWNAAFDSPADCYMLDASDFTIRVAGDKGLKFYRCKKCGRLTSYFVKGQCAYVKCDGVLEEINPEEELKNNHYAKLYQSEHMNPLRIKEHTAQLTRDHQTRYQEAFVKGEINALSCSTTFEMGVDVGSLETVYMRNVPPNPSNYVQRAGRAGRGAHSAAFVLTYVKLSSHDLTFYQSPAKIISGQIQAPIFSVQNEKVVRRHIYAVALSKFFAAHPDDVYDGNNQSVFLNGNGYELLKDYLAQKPDSLKQTLQASIPKELHQQLGINDFSWTEELTGENGVLEIAVREFRDEVKELEKALRQFEREKDHAAAARAERALQQFRCDKEKDEKQRPKQLIDFLARNNVLPKYGFPVDTVELQIRASGSHRNSDRDSLQLSRDLQMAIADYAPGAQVIADGHMYTSRYIRRLPTTAGGKKDSGWEIGYYAVCPDPDCQQRNFTQKHATKRLGGECVACGKKIPGPRWQRTLEPRRGFWAETTEKEVPLKKPEHDFRTEDCYVGDVQHKQLQRCRFQVNDMQVEMESTANDSLVVMSMNSYYVCPICGYAVDTKKGVLNDGHKDARGYNCRYIREEGTSPSEYRLSHIFKTDVAKITFETSDAQDQEIMLSVLYAMLEGVSRVLDIERTDIKGCLHLVQRSICQKPIYVLILYDAVAGGAGHMRRLVTEDAGVFRRVLDAALHVVEDCSCDPSCYQCIRNYYNQKIHDVLDRKKAAKFLRQWVGEYKPVAIERAEQETSEEELSFHIENAESWEDYGSWDALRKETDLAELENWDAADIPGVGCLVLPTVQYAEETLTPCFLWPTAKVIVFEKAEDFERSVLPDGWRCFAVTVNPEELKSACEGT